MAPAKTVTLPLWGRALVTDTRRNARDGFTCKRSNVDTVSPSLSLSLSASASTSAEDALSAIQDSADNSGQHSSAISSKFLENRREFVRNSTPRGHPNPVP